MNRNETQEALNLFDVNNVEPYLRELRRYTDDYMRSLSSFELGIVAEFLNRIRSMIEERCGGVYGVYSDDVMELIEEIANVEYRLLEEENMRSRRMTIRGSN